ncbi:MAG: hypothetical protein IIX60_04735 [Clostridia bacterium]|nr:hypothetical protein [Clostridia bacterium]
MNVQYLKEVAQVLFDFMKENGFDADSENIGVFKNEFKTYRISYDDNKKLFSVEVCPADTESYTTLSTWYFDEADHGPKDTECIGEDFLEAIAKDAGVKLIKKSDGTATEVAMPEKAAAGTEPGIEAFTQKFLAMFPQYKDAYKETVAKYGDFLYVNFYKKYGVEKMLELMSNEAGNKKQLTKYWNMLGDMHYEGELVVADLICSVILAGSFGKEPEKFDEIADKYLAEYPFLKASAKASVHDYKSNKKLRKVLEA